MVHGAWRMVHGVWCMVHVVGVLRMIHTPWFRFFAGWVRVAQTVCEDLCGQGCINHV